MTMNAHSGSEFDDIVNTETWGPYGSPQPQPVKTGPTKRGKVVLSIGAAVLAGTGILTWQHYDAAEKASQVKAQELSIRQQQIELEKLKVLSEANAKNAKTQATQDAARQKQIDACVSHNKGLIGKQLGATYSSVLGDCQNQYAATGSTAGMQEAASSTDTAGSGGGVSPGLLLAIGAGGALVIAVAANRGKNTNAA
jgi:hypothetical protein